MTDIHKEFVDNITIPSKQGKGVLRRVPEVFDCWFESGSMPYAQSHYPFERKDEFEEHFPADFIAEGIDQTRGWFYTLLVISTAIFDKPPFKNLITNGLVLASDGQKMSKRKKNYPDPVDIIGKYGADSVRLYLISSPAVHGDCLKFNEKGVRDVIKDAFLPWHNAMKFLLQNIEHFELRDKTTFKYVEIKTYAGTNIMDKWILSSMQSLLKFVKNEMDQYHLYTVLPRLVDFIDTLCNWYVRFNRKRLRGETDADDCKLALNTLFDVIFIMNRLCAPFVPFLTESMYQRIKAYIPDAESQKIEYKSVHYLMIPDVNEALIDKDTEKLISVMEKVIVLGRTIRDRKNLPLRHPIKKLVVIAEDDYEEIHDTISKVRQYIYEELNVKDFELTKNRDDFGIELKCKPNFAVLASKVKDRMKVLAVAIEKLCDADVQKLRAESKLTVDGYELLLEDVKISPKCDAQRFSQYEADFDGNVIVLLDVTPDEEMINEGVLRDIVNRIQRLRKEMKIVPTDNITIYYDVPVKESKLFALMNKCLEFVEYNIKKPVKQFDSSLGLKSSCKSFEVCHHIFS